MNVFLDIIANVEESHQRSDVACLSRGESGFGDKIQISDATCHQIELAQSNRLRHNGKGIRGVNRRETQGVTTKTFELEAVRVVPQAHRRLPVFLVGQGGKVEISRTGNHCTRKPNNK